ncbi:MULTISPECIES: ABC transporter permease [Streptomyces]|uniref:ABC transporter permease n=3 Tax=Streptomyces TaxID=1883 RepID=A0ABD5JFZ3_9ACTN|nr:MULTISPECIES: ABC transporter permease [Streptomyces]MEE4587325.1 ABC transporter permease [Streptomyces sp. DSM 41602]KUL66494.1 ABC transporter permease [Streptomyces violaceusniger]QTI90351.1 ABC transporter permease [Streptomyces sp. AgN23]RSS45704.1 ABC transporter permease [Streptomyces sp. WAC05858]WTA86483.1 ABC transporter permease [Streptomyces antimycoticus]
MSADTAMRTTAVPGRPPGRWQRANKATLAMLGVGVALFLGFGIAAPNFLTFTNLANLATQVAITLIVAVAMTFVITTGQIDLSVGSILAFTATCTAEMLQAGWDSSLVIVVALLAGLFWGAVNGWLSAYQKIPPFIVTLATMSVVRGLAQLWTKGFSVPIDARLFVAKIGDASFLGLSALAWIALATVAVGAVLLSKLPFGSYVNGIGSQEESVRRAGVNTARIKMITLMLTGVAAGIAGLLTAARLGSGSANSGQGFELTVIAAVVLGGTNLFGGRGTVLGTVIGALITGVIANGLNLLGVSPFLTPIVTGLVLLAAIWLNLRGRAMADLFAHLTGRS